MKNSLKIKMRQVEEKLFVLYYQDKPLHFIKENELEAKPRKRIYWSIQDAVKAINLLPPSIDRDQVQIMTYTPSVYAKWDKDIPTKCIFTKVCKDCKERKIATRDFSKAKGDYLQSYCKTCASRRYKEYVSRKKKKR